MEIVGGFMFLWDGNGKCFGVFGMEQARFRFVSYLCVDDKIKNSSDVSDSRNNKNETRKF